MVEPRRIEPLTFAMPLQRIGTFGSFSPFFSSLMPLLGRKSTDLRYGYDTHKEPS